MIDMTKFWIALLLGAVSQLATAQNLATPRATFGRDFHESTDTKNLSALEFRNTNNPRSAGVKDNCTLCQLQVPGIQGGRRWKYSAEALRPFWQSEIVHRESVLFVRDSETGTARGSLLFPIKEILSVQNSAGTVNYQRETDFEVAPGSQEIRVPAGSRIVAKSAEELRRPANSQKHRLTHRDGNGEILFGATLEYHHMQTWITYSKASDHWPVDMPHFDAAALPGTIKRLQTAEPVSIVLLGDSISTGCNASGWAEQAPFQPAYQDLLVEHLSAEYKADVTLTNLSVGGTATSWGIQQIDKVIAAKPHLVILAFGMNDSAGRTAIDYGKNISQMIANTRASLPSAEFILIAPMLANRDWTVLKHDLFPAYRDELAKQCKPGVALADMTSVWAEFLKHKMDRDLTGNGVNHPNDFGHRVYAQVLSAILVQPE